MARTEVRVPDIGDFHDVAVIELLVKAGDVVKVEQSLITVESDKASMEIPSSHAGVVQEMRVKLGDKVNQGDVLAVLEVAAGVERPASGVERGAVATADHAAAVSPSPAGAGEGGAAAGVERPASGVERGAVATAGNAAAVSPSPAGAGERGAAAGVERPASGVEREAVATAGNAAAVSPSPAGAGEGGGEGGDAATLHAARPTPDAQTSTPNAPQGLPHASPSVRQLARQLGVPLGEVKGSGPKGRITQEDVQAFTRAVMSGSVQTQAQTAKTPAGSGAALDVLPWPSVDFAKFGPVERKELSRIKKISGANLHRNWVMIPHVTNNDAADITELEAFRVATNKDNEKSGVKVTMLAFVIKAVVSCLKKYPEFNASLDGDALIYKQYFHIGFAADTPNGLVVPVLKNADQKGILQISQEMGELAQKAREGKLPPTDMQGGCFSISSLGGIGGTHFTPIINAPEVAILGLSKSSLQPVWNGEKFKPRLMLPLSLSYDHRVIDGAAAARFNATLGQLLADYRRIVL